MAAFTAERSDYGSKAISVYDFDNDYLLMWNLGAAKKQNKPSSGRGMSSLASVLGRVNYNLKERYLFTASFRYDGSSKFSRITVGHFSRQWLLLGELQRNHSSRIGMSLVI